MKINAQDEYGLRILLQIAREDSKIGLSTPQLSELEGLSTHYVAKLTRTLRIAGFIKSTRGYRGGYVLTRSAGDIKIKDVLNSLGGNLFDDKFCGNHAGVQSLCTNSIDCSIRSLWKIVQLSIDSVLDKITLEALMNKEKETSYSLNQIFDEGIKELNSSSASL